MLNDTTTGPWNPVNNLNFSVKEPTAPVAPPAPVPLPASPCNARAPAAPTPVLAAVPPTPVPVPVPANATVDPTQQSIIPLGALNLEALPKDMTVEQLIQTRKAASTPFITANGAPILCLMPPPPPPTPGGSEEGGKMTNAAIAKLTATANQQIPQAPPDIDVVMDGGGNGFDYCESVPDPVVPPVTTQACTMSPPQARAPRVSPVPVTPLIIPSGVSTLLSAMEQCFYGLVSEPVRLFHKQHQSAQETKRILAATTPVALEHSAKDIAAEVNDKHAVTPKNRRDVPRTAVCKVA